MREKNFLVILVWLVLSMGCIPFCSGCGRKTEGILIAAAEDVVPATAEEAAGWQELSGAKEAEGQQELPGTEDSAGQKELSGAKTDAALQEDTGEELYIYVCGQVRAPGVYILPRGARICDAIEMAGGFSEEAAEDYWNLAQVLSDGQMLAVPTKEEAAERPFPSFSTGTEQALSSGGEPDTKADRININTATKEELMEIPGIGAAKAEDILAYRKENGPFSGVREIMNVSGIKEGLFQKMEDYITVE